MSRVFILKGGPRDGDQKVHTARGPVPRYLDKTLATVVQLSRRHQSGAYRRESYDRESGTVVFRWCTGRALLIDPGPLNAVRNQRALDMALKFSGGDTDATITVHSPPGLWLEIDREVSCYVAIRGDSCVRVRGAARVSAFDRAQVHAYGQARVSANDNAYVRLHDDATARRHDDAQVRTKGRHQKLLDELI
jgi:hypothetical protein